MRKLILAGEEAVEAHWRRAADCRREVIVEGGGGHHARASKLLLANCGDEFASSAVTLAGVLVGAIRAGRGDNARGALAELQVRALGLTADAAWEPAQLRVRTGLEMPDCCVLYAVLIQRPARFATFDARLAAVAVGLGVGIVPR